MDVISLKIIAKIAGGKENILECSPQEVPSEFRKEAVRAKLSVLAGKQLQNKLIDYLRANSFLQVSE